MASQAYIGAIFIFAGNFAPRNYMLCQGQILPIQQWAALFSILGTTYGGNGTSNFALPDLRGRAPIGQGNPPGGLSPVVLGEITGNNTVSILTSNMPAHNHLISVSSPTGGASQNGPQNNFLAGTNDGSGNPYPSYSATATSGASLAASALSLVGSSLPINIQNPILGINYIIAVAGIFPSRN